MTRARWPSMPTAVAAAAVMATSLPWLSLLPTAWRAAHASGSDVAGLVAGFAAFGVALFVVLVLAIVALAVLLWQRRGHADMVAVCFGAAQVFLGGVIVFSVSDASVHLVRTSAAYEAMLGIVIVAALLTHPARRDFPTSFARRHLPAGQLPWWKGMSLPQWAVTLVAFAFAAAASLSDRHGALYFTVALVIGAGVDVWKGAARSRAAMLDSGPSGGVAGDVAGQTPSTSMASP